MTFATVVNAALVALCVIVVLQSMRLGKAMRDLKNLSLDKGVEQIEIATIHAQAVLTELKAVLRNAATVQSRTVAEAETLREELQVMVGIGNAVAERIVDAAAAQRTVQAQQQKPKAEAAPKTSSMAKPKSEQVNKALIETATAASAPRSADRRGRSRSGGRRAANKLIEQPVKAPTTNTVGQA